MSHEYYKKAVFIAIGVSELTDFAGNAAGKPRQQTRKDFAQ